MKRLLLTCLFLLLASPSWAGRVNRCTDANGKSQYSEMPCPQGNKVESIRTVESNIGGSGSDLQGLLEQERARAERFIGSDDVVRISATRTTQSPNMCNVATQEYQTAKRNLLCWARATCDNDHTRELYKRAVAACRRY
ncbi:DUF4124 domain-containing protein [Chitinimonas naiadis]